MRRPGLIPLNDARDLVIQKPMLCRVNEEGERLGFSRGIEADWLKTLPRFTYRIAVAFLHTSRDEVPLQNIRLLIMLPFDHSGDVRDAADNLDAVTVDVTPDAWQQIKKRSATILKQKAGYQPSVYFDMRQENPQPQLLRHSTRMPETTDQQRSLIYSPTLADGQGLDQAVA